MADTKISGLGDAGTVNVSADYLAIVQGGETKKITPQNLNGGFKIYRAIVNQSGTNPPTATVLINTLSGIPTWDRSTVGAYSFELPGEFLAAKTFIRPLSLYKGNYPSAFVSKRFVRSSNSSLDLTTFLSDFTTPSDNILVNEPIEVCVYL